MKTIRDDIHDKLVATYQSLEASILNAALKESGVADAEVRRKIIGTFLFQQGVLLDQGWFKEEGAKHYPGVFFSSHPHPDIDAAKITLPGPQYGTNFHDYAYGAADWALENEDGGDVIETGNAEG